MWEKRTHTQLSIVHTGFVPIYLFMNSAITLFFQNVCEDGITATSIVDSKHAKMKKRRESINDVRAQLKLRHEEKERIRRIDGSNESAQKKM